MENNLIKTTGKSIDFNCDLGLLDSATQNDATFKLIDFVSTINIACGFHAGTPISIKKVLEFSRYKNKVIGASIGFPKDFEIEKLKVENEKWDNDEIEAMVIYQVGALASYAKSYGLNIEHVRPSGEMYKLCAQNLEFSVATAKAIKKYSQWLNYYGAAGEIIERTASEVNINVAREMHLNKSYKANGEVDFETPDFEEKEKSMFRLERLISTGEIDNVNSELIKTQFDTIHFDSLFNDSVEIAKKGCELIQPTPVNYNKAEPSGWV